MIASDPPKVVHLITRAQGGLHDYQAFLHEAGHALHYAGCDPALPYTFRKLSRDHALTEIYSYIVEAISREPGWHAALLRPLRRGGRARTPRRRSSSRRCSSAATRRSSQFELDFWGRFAEDGGTPGGLRGAADRGDRASATARDGYLSDMDAGFYSADYLRAWIRSAQLRAYLAREVGDGLVARAARPASACASSSARARSRRARRSPARIGFEPLDTGPLLAELGA